MYYVLNQDFGFSDEKLGPLLLPILIFENDIDELRTKDILIVLYSSLANILDHLKR